MPEHSGGQILKILGKYLPVFQKWLIGVQKCPNVFMNSDCPWFSHC